MEFQPVEKICEVCGKTFLVVTPQQVKLRKYCSGPCRSKAVKKREREERKSLRKSDPILTKTKVTSETSRTIRKKGIDHRADIFSQEGHYEAPEAPKEGTLEFEAMRARAAGESYGKYTSRKYAPELDFSRFKF